MKIVLEKCIIAHNTGLGDHIMMNGAVRSLLDIYDEVYILTYNKKVKNVRHMYRDEPRIYVVPEKDAEGAQQAQKKIRKLQHQYRLEGFDTRMFFWPYMNHWKDIIKKVGLDPVESCWCEAFYKAVDVDYKERYASFHFERDNNREREIFKRLKLPKEYIFVAKKRANRRIHDFKLDTDLPIIDPDSFRFHSLVFDWMSVIENATEIHTIDTSWFHLIKSMRLNNKPKFFHRYARPVPACGENYLNDEYDNGWTDLRE
tara:strand:+ start:158 stop:931 length:774 start_codon:yes stop_codon:yes gene_type:complete